MPVAISLPMRVDDFGRIVSASAQEKVWADRVRTVIGTTVGERVMRPDFGTRIPYGLLDSVPELPQLIEDSVSVAFLKFLPTLQLASVTLFEEIEEDSTEVSMVIVYAIPGASEPSVLTMPYGGDQINV